MATDLVEGMRMGAQPQLEVRPAEEIAAAVARGETVLLYDDINPEAGGDLVSAAELTTPDRVNFMAREGRGLICVALTGARAGQLDLRGMPLRSPSRHGLTYTVSVEATTGVTTGISAHDRARTIAVLADDASQSEDLVSPGHVFPIITEAGGVLSAARTTEAAIDLARIAGLKPILVICKVLNEDGMVANVQELWNFAATHDLPVCSVSELIRWRSANEVLVEEVRAGSIRSRWGGQFDLKILRDLTNGAQHLVLFTRLAAEESPKGFLVHRMDWASDVLGLSGGPATPVAALMRRIAKGDGGDALILLSREPASAASTWLEPLTMPQTLTAAQEAIAAQIYRLVCADESLDRPEA